MKVLFLDFDGVLNSDAFFATIDVKSAEDRLDPDAITRLNRVLDQTGAKVVVSSTWRIFHTQERLAEVLRSFGFSGEVIGTTPIIGGPRGNEIQAWLDENGRTKSFAIVDDNDDMAGLKRRLIRTTKKAGLQDEHVEPLCRMLDKRRWWPF